MHRWGIIIRAVLAVTFLVVALMFLNGSARLIKAFENARTEPAGFIALDKDSSGKVSGQSGELPGYRGSHGCRITLPGHPETIWTRAVAESRIISSIPEIMTDAQIDRLRGGQINLPYPLRETFALTLQISGWPEDATLPAKASVHHRVCGCEVIGVYYFFIPVSVLCLLLFLWMGVSAWRRFKLLNSIRAGK
jgi:hypothetical protein